MEYHDGECCTAHEDDFGCTLAAGHEGPHEAWGLDRIMVRWGPTPRSPKHAFWRDYQVAELQGQTRTDDL